MAQLERLQKSLETLKILQVSCISAKSLIPPSKILYVCLYNGYNKMYMALFTFGHIFFTRKQETLLNKSQYIHECNTISEIICAPLTRFAFFLLEPSQIT